MTTLPALSATIKNRSPKNLFLVAKDDKAVEKPIFDENMKVKASSCRVFQQGKVWKKILKEWPGYWFHQYLEITEMNYVINGLTEATLITFLRKDLIRIDNGQGVIIEVKNWKNDLVKTIHITDEEWRGKLN